MNQEGRIVSLRLPYQPVRDAVPQVYAKGLGQRVYEVTAPRLIEDPFECSQQMTEGTNAARF